MNWNCEYDYPAVDASKLLANRQKPIAYEALNKMGYWYDLDKDMIDLEFNFTRGSKAKWYGGITLQEA